MLIMPMVRFLELLVNVQSESKGHTFDCSVTKGLSVILKKKSVAHCFWKWPNSIQCNIFLLFNVNVIHYFFFDLHPEILCEISSVMCFYLQ